VKIEQSSKKVHEKIVIFQVWLSTTSSVTSSTL